MDPLRLIICLLYSLSQSRSYTLLFIDWKSSLVFCALVNQIPVLKSLQQFISGPFLIQLYKSPMILLLCTATNTVEMLEPWIKGFSSFHSSSLSLLLII